jgi:RNA methyltransferase, TrmH family
MIEVITSAGNAQIKALRTLEQKKERSERGLFVLEGERNIKAALASGWQLDTLVSIDGYQVPKLLQPEGVRLLVVTAELMARLSGRDNPQPVWAALRQRWVALDEATHGLWVALESIQDPGNLGTIMRSGAAAGAAGVIMIGNCCDAYAPESIRASVGTFASVKLIACTCDQFLAWRSTYRGQVVATHLAGSVDYRAPTYKDPLILLMGSESDGLSDKLVAAADIKVRIPMSPHVESLNVATATALMLYRAANLA